MLVSSLVTITTLKAINWLTVGKVVTIIGSGCLTAAPAIQQLKSRKKGRK